MILLVCGGRALRDWDLVRNHLDATDRALHITRIIHGGAPGADALARHWAGYRGVPVTVFPADWHPNGGSLDRSAGPRRNARMLAEGRPSGVLAFPGGAGTADMVSKARAAGIPVFEVPDGLPF